MSKENKLIFLLTLVFVLITQSYPRISAQIIEVKIKIPTASPTVIEIQGVNLDAGTLENEKNFSFLQSHAGIENLGERVSDVNLFGVDKRKIEYKKFSAGEFLAEKPVAFWNYKIKADVSTNPAALARVSWLSDEQGILMLDDLLRNLISKVTKKNRR